MNKPGSFNGFPFLSFKISPVSDPSFLLILPASRISNATAFALLVEVVFKLMLYATRKSRAEIAVAPDFLTDLLNSAGPKSGFHSESFNFFDNPSYSPFLQLARFFFCLLLQHFHKNILVYLTLHQLFGLEHAPISHILA